MNEISPCKGCTERHPGCHDSCPRYQEWKNRHLAQQKHLADNRYRNCPPFTESRERQYKQYSSFLKSGFKRGGYQ